MGLSFLFVSVTTNTKARIVSPQPSPVFPGVDSLSYCPLVFPSCPLVFPRCLTVFPVCHWLPTTRKLQVMSQIVLGGDRGFCGLLLMRKRNIKNLKTRATYIEEVTLKTPTALRKFPVNSIRISKTDTQKKYLN
uniref:Uncharacterized protein n=1 Tax=Octopus bimaculoides TaxID=37653 RepID=A0A0L8I4M8_OCTBM